MLHREGCTQVVRMQEQSTQDGPCEGSVYSSIRWGVCPSDVHRCDMRGVVTVAWRIAVDTLAWTIQFSRAFFRRPCSYSDSQRAGTCFICRACWGPGDAHAHCTVYRGARCCGMNFEDCTNMPPCLVVIAHHNAATSLGDLNRQVSYACGRMLQLLPRASLGKASRWQNFV